jgi:protein-L-isoaspartate(D-aspartate) O-methyltransferase
LRLADGTAKAVRYDKAAGAAGYRILFDAPAPLLEAFAPAAEFTF